MAKAELVVPAAKVDVLLTLSPYEAEALGHVLATIGGDATTTKRKYTDAINTALVKVGFGYSGDFKRHFEEIEGKLQFLKEIE